MTSKILSLLVLFSFPSLCNAQLFTESDPNVIGVSNGDAQWVDYDSDGDLNICVMGNYDPVNTQTSLYQNDNGIFIEVFQRFL